MYAEISLHNVAQFKPLLEEEKVYELRKFIVATPKKAFKPVEAPFMIWFTKHTVVEEKKLCLTVSQCGHIIQFRSQRFLDLLLTPSILLVNTTDLALLNQCVYYCILNTYSYCSQLGLTTLPVHSLCLTDFAIPFRYFRCYRFRCCDFGYRTDSYCLPPHAFNKKDGSNS